MARSIPGAPRFFYGWSIVAIAFVTMGVGVNARTAFSLFFPPILDEFGWPRGLTAGAFSFGFLVSAVLRPLLRRLVGRRGPRAGLPPGLALAGPRPLPAELVRAAPRARDRRRVFRRGSRRGRHPALAPAADRRLGMAHGVPGDGGPRRRDAGAAELAGPPAPGGHGALARRRPP